MNKQTNITAIFASLLLLVFIIACGGNQVEEANKLISDANKLVDEAKELVVKTDARNKELFSEDIKETLKDYKRKMAAEAKSIVEDYAKAADKSQAAGKKFAEAGKLNVADKFKEYLDLKAKEFDKRAEAINFAKGNAQAFIDLDDVNAMQKQFGENNKKSQSLMKEAEELAGKAEKIQTEHKEIFKS